jgi:adenylate cyclase
MTGIIVRHNGTIDEFIGDAILVIFGAPIRREDDAVRAVACAVEMQLAMVEVNARARESGLPEVEMGIGVNTGEVVVGNIGSSKRAKYGVVGSAVNLTSRIESYTVGGQILISESTLADVPIDLRIDSEMKVEPKGVRDPLSIHEIGGIGAPYGLSLPKEASLLGEIEPSPIRFTILEGKHATGEAAEGRIVRLSAREAEIVSDTVPPPLTNVRIRLADEAQSDLYAKSVARAPVAGNFVVRFTSIPRSAERFFALALGATGSWIDQT